MTATLAPTHPTDPGSGGTLAEPLPPRPGAFARYVRETALLVGRSLRTIPRVPERLSDVTIQPIIFTLLFLYVFGSAIHIPGMRYQDYLLPGLIGQSLAFGIIGAGVATANDFSTGVVDRFRSLPVNPLSVISAQVIGQILEQVLGLVIVLSIGLALGWRPDLDLGGAAALAGLVLLGLFAFTWFGVLLGMLIGNADAMQGIGFAVVFPLSFLAGTFVPIAGMKAVPRAIGEWDPLAAFVAGVRELCTGVGAHGSWQLEHPIPAMVGWCALIIAVCVPLALRRFRRAD
ncbi:ABC transporter permease [Aquihabitans sp. G128]|uniref:ABC transporter permease n=1 Tax=Aquihabitans sp. G128 TaxID=2849779 RepID=UPI001C21B8F3|nr:ABC transporter permease [Aquihabitans sp. G128]QXC60720.1 ABC transporter permease [Aquihabitans sp. G128]